MIREFFIAPQNASFIWALGILTGVCILVVLGTLLGAIHMPEADADLDVDWSADGLVDGTLEFVGLAAIPLSMFVVIASCTFFVTGYTIQMIGYSINQVFFPGWIAIVPSLFVTVLTCRTIGRYFARMKFKLDTSAVSSESFIYRHATIQRGTARAGLAAEAKLVDEHGQTHYILVEPQDAQTTFTHGQQVVLVERAGSKFLAVSTDIDELFRDQQ